MILIVLQNIIWIKILIILKKDLQEKVKDQMLKMNLN